MEYAINLRIRSSSFVDDLASKLLKGKMMMKNFIFAVLFSSVLLAQDKSKSTVSPPAPTEVQWLKYQNFNLNISVTTLKAQQDIQTFQQQRQQLIADIEKEHPGYHWNFSQDPAVPDGLVANKPDPKPEKKK